METVAYVWACSNCHVRADPGQRFCRRCGTAIVPPPPIDEEPAVILAPEPSSSRASRLWLLLLAVIALLFLALGGAAALVLANSTDTPAKPVPSTAPREISAATTP